MKSRLIQRRWWAGAAAAGLLALSPAISVRAQSGAPPGAGAPAVINPKGEDRARQLSEGRLRSAEIDAVAETENQKRIGAALVHLKEDFTRIQVLRNDIARDLVARKPLNYGLVSDQTGEINKRATDLNIYMLAHEEKQEKEEETKPAELQTGDLVSALVKLCKLIDSFTENPALKNAATVNVKEMAKTKTEIAEADKELLAIIKLSESIRKKSDSLK
jgi:hypothetical protein